MDQLFGFLPIILMQAVFAVPAALLARRLDASPTLWAILALIPIIGLFFMYYVGYRVVATVLDRLNELAARDASG